jgi:Ni,Fe-hydrogenase III small subunit
MPDFIRTRLAQGSQTLPFPGEVALPSRFRGRPRLHCAQCAGEACRLRGSDAPSELIATDREGRTMLDVGAALFAPEEAVGTQECGVTFTQDYALSARTPGGFRSQSGELERMSALGEDMLRLFGRSLRLRSVSAGSCAGCEAELTALGNVVFDLARFGIQFVASPRHADGIIVTGTVNANMREALKRTFDATPDPKIVIAVGACAYNGGPFRGSEEAGTGVGDIVPVDLWIAGCPPHPVTILDGLLRLLGRIGRDPTEATNRADR